MTDWRTRLDKLRSKPWAGMTRAEKRQFRKLLGREKGLGWRICGYSIRGRPRGLEHTRQARPAEMNPDHE